MIEALVQRGLPFVPGNPAAATICLLILYLLHGASRPSNAGYASSLVLPLITEDKVFGAITIYSREPNSFSMEEEALLTELAGDLAYGIQAIRLQDAHALAETELRPRAS